mmetsp:Transcript_2360/g.4979  ORF Transcript_2360/g.4979 Transcript_2360/m.4979 type:complete len:141 (+) Transcript_2360:1319-1741(+)
MRTEEQAASPSAPFAFCFFQISKRSKQVFRVLGRDQKQRNVRQQNEMKKQNGKGERIETNQNNKKKTNKHDRSGKKKVPPHACSLLTVRSASDRVREKTESGVGLSRPSSSSFSHPDSFGATDDSSMQQHKENSGAPLPL